MVGWQKFRQILGGSNRRSHVAIYTMTSHTPHAHLPYMNISSYVRKLSNPKKQLTTIYNG